MSYGRHDDGGARSRRPPPCRPDQLGLVSIVAIRAAGDLPSSAGRSAPITSSTVTAVFWPVARVMSTPSKVLPYSPCSAALSYVSTSLPLMAFTPMNFHRELRGLKEIVWAASV